MTLDGIKALTIPEGAVKKIEAAGTVLWKTPAKPVCAPEISVSYENIFHYNRYWETICTVCITGIQQEFIRSVSAGFQSLGTGGQWVNKLSLSGHRLMQTGETEWEDVSSFPLGTDDRLVKSWNTPRILATLKYTDPEGDDREVSADIPWASPWA